MPYYYFEAVTADGRVRKKILKARDKKEADRQLRNSGLHPILIESAHTLQKRRQEKHAGTRHFLQRAILFVAAISLVVGIATYFIMLDLSSVEKLEASALTRSGIIEETPGIINAQTPEERDFASETREMWETIFPGSSSGVQIKRKTLMVIYVNRGQEFRGQGMYSMTGTLCLAFHKRFNKDCIVLIVQKGKTLAESTFKNGGVETVEY